MKRTMTRLSIILATLLIFRLSSFSQDSEHVVILWDVTASLLPSKAGVKGLAGQPLPVFHNGKGLWVELQKSIIECIQYTEDDPDNEITIVTFHDKVDARITRKATKEGKDELISFVKNYAKIGFGHTNIVAPIEEFYNLVDDDKIDYMYLFTDGVHNAPTNKNAFIPTLNAWMNKASAHKAYGFYVLVDPVADRQEIRQSVESQDNFWIVPDTKERIKICSLPQTLHYNVRDDKGFKTFYIKGKYANAKGKIHLATNDEFYDVICSDGNISNGKYSFEVKVKAGKTPPATHVVTLTPNLSGANQYTFVGPENICLEVSNLPERSLDIELNKDFDDASYYGPFLWCEESSKSSTSDIALDFSKQARDEGSSVELKIYFVDPKFRNSISSV